MQEEAMRASACRVNSHAIELTCHGVVMAMGLRLPLVSALPVTLTRGDPVARAAAAWPAERRRPCRCHQWPGQTGRRGVATRAGRAPRFPPRSLARHTVKSLAPGEDVMPEF